MNDTATYRTIGGRCFRSRPRFRCWKNALLSAAAALAFQTQPATAATMLLGNNFNCLPWGGGDPFVKGAQNVSGENPWKPQGIEELSRYQVLRYMDWTHANGPYTDENYQVGTGFNVAGPAWAQRRQMTDKNQWLMAWEWVIDMSNRTNTHCWINVPHRSDEEYCFELAKLVKERLAPHLQVWIEWSNETWNGVFPVMHYCVKEGQRLKLPPTDNQWYQGWVYHTYAAVRVFEQFEKVFGKNSPRIYKVLAGQATRPEMAETMLAALKNPVVNPAGVKVDAYATAPYYEPNTAEGARATVRKEAAIKKVTNKYGVELIFYEGGQNVEADQILSPKMYEITKAWLDEMAKVGFTKGAFFMHNGHGPWACVPTMAVGYEKCMTYPKYRALAEYCDSNPQYKPVPSSQAWFRIVQDRPEPATHASARMNTTLFNLLGASLETSRTYGAVPGICIYRLDNVRSCATPAIAFPGGEKAARSPKAD